MQRIKKLMRILACVVVSITAHMHGMNLTNMHDIFFKPEFHLDKCYQFDVLVEHGFHLHAFDEFNCVSNALRIYGPEQNALKMLKGFPDNSAIGQLDALINATDDGIRGHFVVDSCLQLPYNVGFAGRYHFWDFIIGAYLHVMKMRMSNVVWHDLTQDITDQDIRVRENLTNNLCSNVQQLGGLFLGGWERTGLSDLLFLLEWTRDFPQQKPFLKNMRLNARLGATIPTGLRQNEDLVFAVPFGGDGAFGLIASAGFDATLGSYFKGGVDVQLIHRFGDSLARRIKTNVDQTSFLLLEKTRVFTDWGLNQQFNLYVQVLYKAFSCKANYQFVKQGDDEFGLYSDCFSQRIANRDNRLEGWTTHTVLVKATYDHYYDPASEARVKPQLSFYAKLPFNGRQSASFSTIGIIGSVDF